MSIPKTLRNQLHTLPSTPGVYLFLSAKKEILYIGKATNLKSRVRSYFSGHDSRGERIRKMVSQIDTIEIRQTESVLEAVILEANLIKKHHPKYNVDLKDDKSYSYFVITKEVFPRIIIERQTDLHKVAYKKIYGPYTSKKQMEIVLKILRKIFPFHSSKQKTEKGCLYYQIGLCPGPYEKAITKKEYLKNVRNIEYVLRGQKKRLLITLQKEMEEAAKDEQFENATDLRNKIHALQHIRDVALLTKDNGQIPDVSHKTRSIRIEGYDISNISGDYAVGSMVVFVGGKPDTSQYRKFKIQTVRGSNDVAMMKEVLTRRLQHAEWDFPDLILLDGGKGHLNMAVKLCKDLKKHIPIAALAKGPTRKKLDLHIAEEYQQNLKITKDISLLEQVRDESHRFAISYHRKLRGKNFIYK